MEFLQKSHLYPVLQWPGGKRQILNQISSLLPTKIDSYYELFIGGGAMLFYLQPQKAIINDINEDLILVYSVIKNSIYDFIEELKNYRNEPDFFYDIRALDRDLHKYNTLSDIKKAARIMYLNKTTNKPDKIVFQGRSRITEKGVNSVTADRITMTVNPKKFEAVGNVKTNIEQNSSSTGKDTMEFSL